MQAPRLDNKDLQILRLLQEDCKLSTRELASKVGSPVTTVYAKMRRMEDLGLIKGYKAVLNGSKLGIGTTAFVFTSVAYRQVDKETLLSQREIAKEVSKFAEVQEVHIIAGDWDLLIKIKAEDVEAVGRFVVDKLRTVKGIEKTLTCVAFDTIREGLSIPI
jgi:Lrp/AsnC family leucine-responsive transcriptional regulator